MTFTNVYMYCIKTYNSSIIAHSVTHRREFRFPSSIRTPRLSGRNVCLPWGSDNRGSTVPVFSTHLGAPTRS